MEMSKITRCDVIDCAYNKDNCCHTIAATFGDGNNPMCDTFFHASVKGGDDSCSAGVGACKVDACKYNVKFECQASSISVGYKDEEPDCLTYDPV